MSYSSLLILTSTFLLLTTTGVIGGENKPSTLISQNSQSQTFWLDAAELVQEQLNIIESIERSLISTEADQVKASRARLILHFGQLERFLKSQYRFPQFLCSNNFNTPSSFSDLDQSQQRVACTLYNSKRQLEPLTIVLEKQAAMLAGLTPNYTLPLLDKPPLRNNYQAPIIPQSALIPSPPPEPRNIGELAKAPTADFSITLPPAIALQTKVIRPLRQTKQRLLSLQSDFPSPIQFYDPAEDREVVDRTSHANSPQEIEFYANFLAQPNTGIARILPAQVYLPDTNEIPNRLQPTVIERFPLISLTPSTQDLPPQLTLEIKDGNFAIPMRSLSYGFMAQLGNIPLEKLDSQLIDLPNLSSLEKEFFLTYTPPQELNAIQIDQRRFFFGKGGLGWLPSISAPVVTQLPAKLNQTYLLRLVQYQLPEEILSLEPIKRETRLEIDQILETPSSDVLVAIRPVHKWINGSYTVLWKVVHQFPNPPITDLETYLELE